MQHAKDSFYVALRDRIATINPNRVVSLRGTERPAVLVEESEPPVGELRNDVFVLRWNTTTFVESVIPLVKMGCEIHYATCGSASSSGLDRGRAMNGMDSELISALNPMSARKMNFVVTPAVALQTYVFWNEAVFGNLIALRDKLQRIASITIFSFLEPGEL